MAGVLYTVYSVAVLVLALLGVLFVFTREWGPEESSWSRWSTVIALAVFLVAMVVSTLSVA
jgi:multisubunit Na+/H+ antiporter MnhE subunit